jgi:hypothetical protein
MSRAPRPRGHGKIPASREMLSNGADPAVDESVSDDCRSLVDPSLLSKLVRMVEVESVEEFVDLLRTSSNRRRRHTSITVAKELAEVS